MFEDAIGHCVQSVSPTNKYQLKLMVLLTLISFSMALQVFASMFFYMNPVFLCSDSPNKLYEDDACPQLHFCSISNLSPIQSMPKLSLPSCTFTVILGRHSESYCKVDWGWGAYWV